jgi:hypothetical protein
MFVRSTGLGRTLLSGRIAKIDTTTLVPATLEEPAAGQKEPMRVLMEMEITNPVHWTVRAFLDPKDLRHMVMLILTNPVFIMNGLKFLFSKGPKYDTPATHEAPAAAAGAAASASKPVAAPSRAPAPSAAPKGPAPIPARR